jgi:hypothetical protein
MSSFSVRVPASQPAQKQATFSAYLNIDDDDYYYWY